MQFRGPRDHLTAQARRKPPGLDGSPIPWPARVQLRVAEVMPVTARRKQSTSDLRDGCVCPLDRVGIATVPKSSRASTCGHPDAARSQPTSSRPGAPRAAYSLARRNASSQVPAACSFQLKDVHGVLPANWAA